MSAAPSPADDLSVELLQAATIWRMRMAAPEWSGDDDAAFEAWLAEDDTHAQAFERTGQVWDFVDDHATAPEVVVIRRDALHRAQQSAKARMVGRSGRFLQMPGRRIAAAAAMAAVLFGAGGYGLWAQGDVYQTGQGERRVVTLEDGSRVSLDALSRVSVKYSRAARRLKLLKGQARFDVAHNAARPFSVEARDRTVVATGTAFNIDIFGKTAKVTLIEGRVVILRAAAPAKAPETPIVLRAGEQLVAGRDAPAKVLAQVNLEEANAWQEGKLMFDKEPLSQAVAEVNRYADRRISIGDAAAGAVPVSGIFHAGDTSAFLEAVTSYLPVSATDGPDGVVLNSTPPRG